MKRRRLIALAVICTICAVGVVILPKLLAPAKTPFGPGPGAREPDIVVFESNAGNYITSCAYSGPFDDAVKIGQLQPAVVDKPATTATVWRAYVGDGASGNMMDLKDVLPFKEGQYFAFDFYIGVDQPRRCTLLIHGFGRMIVYIDDGKMLADQQTDEYGWAKFEAPGDFSDMPRRVSVILECKYTHCALKVGLLQGDKGAIPSTTTVLWPAGGKPADLDLAGRAISVCAAQDGIVDAKEDAFIEVALGGGLPKGFDFSDMTITADWGAGAQVENSFTRDEAVAGARFYIAAPATEATRLQAKVKIALNGNLAGTRSLQYYIPENYGRVITEVEKNAAGLDPKARLPEVTLKLAQLRVLAATKVFDLDKILRLETLLASAGALIGALKENRDPFKGMTGEIERAYISPADGSPQPYKVYLPEDFYITPRPRPLAVFLHGYVIEFTIAQWGEQMEEYVAGWHKVGAVVLQPFGRSNTDFQTIGEEDVIRTVDLVLAEYGCDPRKVYLEGVSMGGMGVWTIGAHYPDKFAAIVPMAGRTDYYYWHSIAADEYPDFKNLLVRSWNPMSLLPNYRYQNIIIGHGKSDRTVEPEFSKRIIDRFDVSGIPYKIKWLDGGHMAVFSEVGSPELVGELSKLVRSPGTEIAFQAYLPYYASRAWLSVPVFESFGKIVDAYGIVEGSEVIVKVENALTVRIRPWKGVLFEKAKIKVIINGDDYGEVELPAEGLEFKLGAIRADRPIKSATLCGPAWKVYCDPFIIVRGDTTTEGKSQRFREWWEKFAKGAARNTKAADVTAEMAENNNLVIFGTPSSNEYLAKIAGRLPFKYEGDNIVLPNGKKFDLTNHGLILVYPNPEAPNRLVMVISGLEWGGKLPDNHLLDLVPDYVVFTATSNSDDMTNNFTAAGFFDTYWQFDEKLMDIGGVLPPIQNK